MNKKIVSDTIFRVALLAGVAMPALAGRPLTTEDAAVLEDKRCQVDAWVERGREVRSEWLVPACNFGAGIEWQLGFARSRAPGEPRHSEAYAQGKKVLRALTEDSAWGTGVVAGVARRPLAESRRGWQNPYVQVPISVGLGPLLVHAQPGWARDAGARRHIALWGVAAESPVSPRLTLLGEAFGQERERPLLRAGLRWAAIRDALSLHLTYVVRIDGPTADRYANVGLTWQSAAFLP